MMYCLIAAMYHYVIKDAEKKGQATRNVEYVCASSFSHTIGILLRRGHDLDIENMKEKKMLKKQQENKTKTSTLLTFDSLLTLLRFFLLLSNQSVAGMVHKE